MIWNQDNHVSSIDCHMDVGGGGNVGMASPLFIEKTRIKD